MGKKLWGQIFCNGMTLLSFIKPCYATVTQMVFTLFKNVVLAAGLHSVE
jgi:hypothetical protein